MDSSTTLNLPSRNRPREHNQDRISQLPDPIIHHIFRFLPIKEAVQSGILAKRWMNLWASMQQMKFKHSEFYDNEKFKCFIYTVLMLRKPISVDTFCLKLGGDIDENHANMWILYAINHNVRVLHLSINIQEEDCHLYLPRCLSTCHSLEDLCVELWTHQKISHLSFEEICRLKRLQFSGVIFNCNDLQKLISGCHWLEDLELVRCDIMDDHSPHPQSSRLDVSSKTMKTLRIRECDIQSMIRFWIPSLISLHYEGSDVEQASFVNLSSLVHAFISDISICNSIRLGSVVDLLYGVSNAKILKLFGSRIEFISDEEVQNLPTFPNLERLTIGRCDVGNNFEAVAYFLQHSPNLRHLTLWKLFDELEPRYARLGEVTEVTEVTRSYAKSQVRPKSGWHGWQSPQSLSFDCPQNLEIIEISCSKTNERILDFVKTLLANAEEALQKIVIIPDFTYKYGF